MSTWLRRSKLSVRRCVLGIWNSKLNANSLSQSLIKSPMCDSRLALNSVPCFETTRETLMHRMRLQSRRKWNSIPDSISDIAIPEIYQGSFWYADVPAWQILTLFDFVLTTYTLSRISAEITLCGVMQLSLHFSALGKIFAISWIFIAFLKASYQKISLIDWKNICLSLRIHE